MSDLLLHRVSMVCQLCKHDDVVKWKHFPRYWPFVRGFHRSQRSCLICYYITCLWCVSCVNMMTSSNGNIFRVTGLLWGEFTGHKGHWRGALMFSLICVWTNSWAPNGDVGDLRRHRAHYDVIVIKVMPNMIEYQISAHDRSLDWHFVELCT